MLEFVTVERDLGDVALEAAFLLARSLGIDTRLFFCDPTPLRGITRSLISPLVALPMSFP